VYALLSVYNTSVDAHRDEQPDSDYWSYYLGEGDVIYPDTMQGWFVGRLGNRNVAHYRDQSWLFMAVYPTPLGPDKNRNLTTFIPYARLYSFSRVPCQGTWSVASGSVNLVDGVCYTDAESAPQHPAYSDLYQYIVTNNQLSLSQGDSDVMHKVFGRLSNGRNATKTNWGETTSRPWQQVFFGAASPQLTAAACITKSRMSINRISESDLQCDR